VLYYYLLPKLIQILPEQKVIRKDDTGRKTGAIDRVLQVLDTIEDLDEGSRPLTTDLKTGRPPFRRKKTNLALSNDDVPRSCPICLDGYKEGDEI
jgi:Asp-tRNA(Asn)/Glu-tRNA(Gln) amidotransferase C subunit